MPTKIIDWIHQIARWYYTCTSRPWPFSPHPTTSAPMPSSSSNTWALQTLSPLSPTTASRHLSPASSNSSLWYSSPSFRSPSGPPWPYWRLSCFLLSALQFASSLIQRWRSGRMIWRLISMVAVCRKRRWRRWSRRRSLYCRCRVWGVQEMDVWLYVSWQPCECDRLVQVVWNWGHMV